MNPDSQPGSVPGQAVGAIIMATGGFVWLLIGTQGVKGDYLVAVPFLLLIASALLLSSQAKRQGIAPLPESDSAARDKALTAATVVEGVAIFAAIIGAQLVRHEEWIPPLIAAIIGLHFVPLARAFRRPLYYLTAAGLCLVAVLVPMLAPLQMRSLTHSGWTLWCGIGSASVLWATAATLLIRGWGLLRQARRSGA